MKVFNFIMDIFVIGCLGVYFVINFLTFERANLLDPFTLAMNIVAMWMMYRCVVAGVQEFDEIRKWVRLLTKEFKRRRKYK